MSNIGLAPHQCVSCTRTDESVRSCTTCEASTCSFCRAGETCVCCASIDIDEPEDD